MRLGLLSDIHEEVDALDWALDRLQREGVDRILCLGDICEAGEHITETCERLLAANVECVWGNHDYGLCTSPPERLTSYFKPAVVGYMQSSVAERIVEDCAFRHIEPCLDAALYIDLWELPNDFGTPERLARNWAAARARRTFMGHLHRWFAASERGPIAWSGDRPLQTGGTSRYLVVIAAVRDGYCAWFDTESGELRPFSR